MTPTRAKTTSEGGPSWYLREIIRLPMLSPEEEFELAGRWRNHQDMGAIHRLVTSHLRLVVKIAMRHRGCGLPVSGLISEGTLGVVQAAQRFDPDRGFRFATYAIWWIRASVQNYILLSSSLVKMGTTTAQKRLFFKLRRMKAQIEAIEDGDLQPAQVARIADTLDVSEQDVISMNRRLTEPDYSLNVPVRGDLEGEWQDLLVDDTESHESAFAEREERDWRKVLLAGALRTLEERERCILIERRLKDNPKTLDELAQQHGVSRERIRQIEIRALEKLREIMKRQFSVPGVINTQEPRCTSGSVSKLQSRSSRGSYNAGKAPAASAWRSRVLNVEKGVGLFQAA